MASAYSWAMRTINRLDMQEWMILLVAVLVAGAVCLRGQLRR